MQEEFGIATEHLLTASRHLIWPARELSVSAVPARAWAFLRQRRSGRELSLSNTRAASLRPSRPINLRPEATAISTRSTAVGRSTERAERTSDVTQIIRAGPMPRPTQLVHVSASASRLCRERRLQRARKRPNPKQNDPRSRRRLRRRATGRRAEQGCAF
jgi:hypothetical protein